MITTRQIGVTSLVFCLFFVGLDLYWFVHYGRSLFAWFSGYMTALVVWQAAMLWNHREAR